MARRRKSRLGAVKVCKVVRGKVKCKSLSGMKRRRSRSVGAMPKRSARTGRFVKSR